MYSQISLPSFRRPAPLRFRAGALAFMIAAAPALALAAPSEPAKGGVPVPTAGLVNAALAASMQARSPSLRGAISRHNEALSELVYNSDRAQEAPAQRRAYELSLLDAVEMALRNNLNVQVARYGPESSFHGINSARGAFDATMTFSIPSSFSRGSQPTTNQIDGGDIITSQNLNGGFTWSENLEWGTNYSLSYTTSRNSSNNELSTFNPSLSAGLRGNLSQPLLRNRGDVNRTGIRVAMNSYDSSLEGFRGQVQNIVFQTISAYWNLRAQSEVVSVRENALDEAEQQYRRNRIQVEIGTLAPIETVQAQTAAAGAELTLIQARNALENAQDQLKELLNFDVIVDDPFAYDLIPTEEPEQEIAPIDVDEAVRIALENDPGLAQQRLGLRSAGLNLGRAKNQLLPNLSVNATFNLQGRAGSRLLGGFGGGDIETISTGLGTALGQIFSGDFNTWSVGASITMPLHNRSAKASVATSEINQRQQTTSYAQAEQQLSYNVRQQVRAVENLVRQVATSTLSRELSERQLEAEKRKFEVGTSTNFNVLTFQNDFANAQLSELQAILQLQNAIAQLELNKGTILQTFGVQIGDAGTGGGREELDRLPEPNGGR